MKRLSNLQKGQIADFTSLFFCGIIYSRSNDSLILGSKPSVA